MHNFAFPSMAYSIVLATAISLQKINFLMQQYKKLKVQHFTCLLEKTGFVSLLSNNMFLQIQLSSPKLAGILMSHLIVSN